MDWYALDGLIIIVVLESVGAGIQSEQCSGKESETYPGGNCKRPNFRSRLSNCDLAGNNQTLGSSEELRQVSDFCLETCASSACTVCPARPIHYTKDAPHTRPECLHLPDWDT